MVALYDAPSAQIACEAGIDAVLVGDSLGNTVLGHDSTIPVTLDDIARHLGAVVRGVKSSSRPDVPIVADMPFATYATPEKAVENAAKLMQLGAHAVKIEGVLSDNYGQSQIFPILANAGIPIMGHLGFTPQSVLRFPSVVQGKTVADAGRLTDEARTLENAGCFAVVLEAMTREVAAHITRILEISTIGIGAGLECDGQILVWHDLVGLTQKPPKFAKKWADSRAIWDGAVKEYVAQVQNRAFPASEHSWSLSAAELEKWEENGTPVNFGENYSSGFYEPFETPGGRQFLVDIRTGQREPEGKLEEELLKLELKDADAPPQEDNSTVPARENDPFGGG